MMENNAIFIKDLKFSWNESDRPLLNIESFSVEKGEKVFLRGPSGSGKSTLLNLLGGVLLADEGRIDLLGTSLNSMNTPERDRFRGDHMGFIFQMFNLIPYLNATENTILPCHFSSKKLANVQSKKRTMEEEAENLLTSLKLDASAIHSRNVQMLSVGQQQRVAVARALIGDPEIIIADEPTSALDSDARDSFMKMLFDKCEEKKMTLLFVSHDASVGKFFDRTIELSDLNKVEL